jgi:hypothetical protein
VFVHNPSFCKLPNLILLPPYRRKYETYFHQMDKESTPDSSGPSTPHSDCSWSVEIA